MIDISRCWHGLMACYLLQDQLARVKPQPCMHLWRFPSDSERLKIITVEDPVEYQLEGVNQIQVQAQIELTFARALRSILRQDPDIIMIGEMRDTETAQIGVQSALTGHLVLSTLHTNTAAGAITRLEDMGVERYLITSSVNGVLAQRLVRTLCSSCKEEVPPVRGYYPAAQSGAFPLRGAADYLSGGKVAVPVVKPVTSAGPQSMNCFCSMMSCTRSSWMELMRRRSIQRPEARG